MDDWWFIIGHDLSHVSCFSLSLPSVFLELTEVCRPLASSMFAPGVGEVLKEFGSTSSIMGSLCVSIYILGYAVGPLFIAPLSEMYGRMILYNCTNVLFIIFTVACALSTNLNMLIGFRFLAGCIGLSITV